MRIFVICFVFEGGGHQASPLCLLLEAYDVINEHLEQGLILPATVYYLAAKIIMKNKDSIGTSLSLHPDIHVSKSLILSSISSLHQVLLIVSYCLLLSYPFVICII